MNHFVSVSLLLVAFATFALGSPVGNCPTRTSRHHLVTLLPDDKDCAKLWICNHGVGIPIKCPHGLVFNAALGVCDWPNSEENECAEPTPEPELQTTVDQEPTSNSTIALQTEPPQTTVE